MKKTVIKAQYITCKSTFMPTFNNDFMKKKLLLNIPTNNNSKKWHSHIMNSYHIHCSFRLHLCSRMNGPHKNMSPPIMLHFLPLTYFRNSHLKNYKSCWEIKSEKKNEMWKKNMKALPKFEYFNFKRL
jgi:hypothetical protein